MNAGPRFLTLADVAEILNTSLAQVTALVRRGELRALKLGGRGQWRVETSELEAFIERMYAETAQQRRPTEAEADARAGAGATGDPSGDAGGDTSRPEAGRTREALTATMIRARHRPPPCRTALSTGKER